MGPMPSKSYRRPGLSERQRQQMRMVEQDQVGFAHEARWPSANNILKQKSQSQTHLRRDAQDAENTICPDQNIKQDQEGKLKNRSRRKLARIRRQSQHNLQPSRRFQGEEVPNSGGATSNEVRGPNETGMKVSRRLPEGSTVHQVKKSEGGHERHKHRVLIRKTTPDLLPNQKQLNRQSEQTCGDRSCKNQQERAGDRKTCQELEGNMNGTEKRERKAIHKKKKENQKEKENDNQECRAPPNTVPSHIPPYLSRVLSGTRLVQARSPDILVVNNNVNMQAVSMQAAEVHPTQAQRQEQQQEQQQREKHIAVLKTKQIASMAVPMVQSNASRLQDVDLSFAAKAKTSRTAHPPPIIQPLQESQESEQINPTTVPKAELVQRTARHTYGQLARQMISRCVITVTIKASQQANVAVLGSTATFPSQGQHQDKGKADNQGTHQRLQCLWDSKPISRSKDAEVPSSRPILKSMTIPKAKVTFCTNPPKRSTFATVTRDSQLSDINTVRAGTPSTGSMRPKQRTTFAGLPRSISPTAAKAYIEESKVVATTAMKHKTNIGPTQASPHPRKSDTQLLVSRGSFCDKPPINAVAMRESVAQALKEKYKADSEKLKIMREHELKVKLAFSRAPEGKSMAEKKRRWVGQNGTFSKERLEPWFLLMETPVPSQS